MYDLFFEHVKGKVPLTEEGQELISQYLSIKKLRKKQYLLQEGDVCKCVAFIEKGAMRSYIVQDDGSEHIVQFALEGQFMTDLYSFLTGEPSDYNIDAIEASELVTITKSSNDELRKRSPEFQEFIFLQTSEAYTQLERRMNSVLSLSLEERYRELTERHPNIVQRVPQHMMASYMGLSPETLSRIRKRISKHR